MIQVNKKLAPKCMINFLAVANMKEWERKQPVAVLEQKVVVKEKLLKNQLLINIK